MQRGDVERGEEEEEEETSTRRGRRGSRASQWSRPSSTARPVVSSVIFHNGADFYACILEFLTYEQIYILASCSFIFAEFDYKCCRIFLTDMSHKNQVFKSDSFNIL